jgi:hypothetical protein
MSVYHRRHMFIYCFIFLLLIIQPLIYIFYFSNSDSDNKIPTLSPDIIDDKTDIIKLNPRILCWIPTTLERLDRAIVVHE